MKTLAIITVILLAVFSASSRAQANCFAETYDHFEEKMPKHKILSVSFEGVLLVGEQLPLPETTVVNATNFNVAVYVIESLGQRRRSRTHHQHVALVDVETCRTVSLKKF